MRDLYKTMRGEMAFSLVKWFTQFVENREHSGQWRILIGTSADRLNLLNMSAEWEGLLALDVFASDLICNCGRSSRLPDDHSANRFEKRDVVFTVSNQYFAR